jgi:hypothetical protein
LQSFIRVNRVPIYHGKDFHFCVGDHRVTKTHWLAIDQDQVNLGMWNPTRLDDILYGRLFGESPLDYCLAGV